MANFTKMKLWLLTMLLLVGSVVWGQTVTYTISSKNTLTTSGIAPAGSSASIVETFSTSKQITSGNSQTLTLSGYSGYKITSITLSMRSNASAGAGNLIYKVDGGIDQTIIATNSFNQAAWNGSWSTTYVPVIKTVDITCGTTTTILKIAATVNSLYCESYTLTYESVSSCTSLGTPTVTPTAGNTEATLSWGAVANATSYTLIWNGGSPETVTSPVTKTGLTNGTSYSYSVMAVGDGTTYCATNTAATGNVTPVAPSYTITPSSNNVSFGTVSLSGSVITGAPLAGYTYASPAYTVLSGTATVSQNGNEFTVTPTSNCAVRINFEAKPHYTLSLSNDGDAYSDINFPFTTYEGNTITLPTLDNCSSYTFVGWDTNSSTTSAPTYAGGATYTTTSGDVTLYAVFSQTTEGLSETLIKSIGFESSESFTASTTYNNTTANQQGPIGERWNFIMGTPSVNAPITGSQSAQMRSYANNSNIGSVTMDYDLARVTKVTFQAKHSDGIPTLNCYYSTNNGTTWSSPTPFATNTTEQEFTFNISETGEYNSVRIKFENAKVNAASRLFIDDVKVYSIANNSTTIYTTFPNCGATQLNVSETTLSGFTYAQDSGPSSEQSFTVSGVNLTNNISIAASANYEISKTSGSGYASPLTFTPGEAATPQTVYVRLKSGLAEGNFNDEVINITSTGADAKTVTVSGSVTAPLNPEPSAHVTGFGADEDGQNAIILDWTDAAGADGYLIKASTVSYAAITAPVDGTPETNSTLVKNVVQGDEIVEFTGLAAGTTYYFKIWPYSNSGASIDYKTDGSVPEASATTEAPVSGLQLSNVNTKYMIDFDNTVNNVNNGQFAGTGFTPIPEVGQLNSYSWAMTGMSEGSLAFGQIRTSSDFTGGISTGNVTSGGTYAFVVSEGNNALGFQPTGNDWAPGTVTLKLQNKTGAAINTLSVAYNVYIRNDQGRSSSFAFSHSEDDNNYTNIPTLMLISDETADASPTWKKYYRSAELTGLNIPNDAYYYIRWSGADVAGGGSRDEFALDDIQLIANSTSVKPEISGVVEDLIVEGDLEIATSLTVNNKLTVTGSLTNNGTLTLKSDANGTATLLNTGTVSTGSYVVEQYLAGSRNWYVASPVSNANALSGFEYWQYNEPDGSSATENWTVVSASTPLVPGRGYVVKPSAETTYAFSTTTGTLNTGVVTVPLTRTVGVTKEGFNLVGNPYPSYLNLNDLLTGDLETSYWMRSRNAGNTAWIFDSFNKDGNVAVNNSGKTVTTYVPPMQSFWVRVKSGVASTNLVFNNTMRAHIDEPANRFRAPQNTPLIRLEMSNGTASDQTVLYAHADASDAFDRFDTHKMLNNSAAVPDIYSMLGSQKMVINGMQSLPLNIEMPLGILVKEAGSFSIRASEVRAIDADIVLIDKLNGNAEWLLNGGAEYQFASSTTTHAERFALVLRAPGTTTGECCNDILGAQTMVFVDAFKNINISCAMPVNKNAKVAVYNAVGQMLTQQNLENGVARIAVANHGVYLVELNVDGLKTTKRVIVK